VSTTTPDQMTRVQEIVAQLDENMGAQVARERRVAPRVKINIPVKVILLSGPTPAPVEVYSRNISLSGLGFVSKRLFRRDERVAVVLRFGNLPTKLVLTRITFGRYVSEGLHEVGAEFLECIVDTKGKCDIPHRWVNAAHQAAITSIRA